MSSLAFGPDEKTLFVEIKDNIEVWNLETEQRQFEFTPCGPGDIRSHGAIANGKIAVTPQGLVAGGWICNPTTGERVKKYGAVSPIAVSPSGVFATRGETNLEPFRIMELDTLVSRKLYDRWPVNLKATPSSFAFSPTGDRLAIGFALTGGGAAIVNVENPSERRMMEGVKGWLFGVEFSPDGQLLAGAAWHNAVYLWDSKTGAVVKKLETPDRNNQGVAFAPDGKSVWAVGTDHTVRVWSVPDGTPLFQDDGHKYGVRAVAVSPDGKLIASIDNHRTIQLWDAAKGQRVAILPHSPSRETRDPLFSVAFSPDGKFLATGGNVLPNTQKADEFMRAMEIGLGKVQVFSISETELVAAHTVHPIYVDLVRYAPGGNLLACAGSNAGSPQGNEKVIKLIDAATGDLKSSLSFGGIRLQALDFSTDGKLLATASGWIYNGQERTPAQAGFVDVWDVEQHKAIRSFRSHTGGITTISFKPHSTTLATGGADNKVCIWGEVAGEPIRVLEGHEEPIRAVAYSPNGRILASAGDDRSIVIWNATTGEKLTTLTGHMGAVTSLAFMPDGRHLVSGSMDTTVMVWDVEQAVGASQDN